MDTSPPAWLPEIAARIYPGWVQRKAVTLCKRDQKRGGSSNVQEYRIAIHNAVVTSGGLDHWTGEQLDWHMIGTYYNDAKHEMTPEELLEFCRRVIAHAEAKKASVADCG